MKIKELRTMTEDDIRLRLTEIKDKLFKQKLQKSLGQAENPYKLRESRKDIARMLTVLTEKEKGINHE